MTVSAKAKLAAQKALAGRTEADSNIPLSPAARAAAANAIGGEGGPKRGPKPSSLIPIGTGTAGSMLGGVAGAAIGAATPIPGGAAIGYELGTGLGGAAGDAGGELIRQGVEGEPLDYGKAAKSGAITGVTSLAVPPVLKGAGIAGRTVLGKIQEGAVEAHKYLSKLGTGLIPEEVFDSPILQMLSKFGEYGLGGTALFARAKEGRQRVVQSFLDKTLGRGEAASLGEVGGAVAKGISARKAAVLGDAQETIAKTLSQVGQTRVSTRGIINEIDSATSAIKEMGGASAWPRGAVETPLSQLRGMGQTMADRLKPPQAANGLPNPVGFIIPPHLAQAVDKAAEEAKRFPTFATFDAWRKSIGDLIYNPDFTKQERATVTHALSGVYDRAREAQQATLAAYDASHGTNLLSDWVAANKVYEKNLPIFRGGVVSDALSADERANVIAKTGGGDPAKFKGVTKQIYQKEDTEELIRVRNLLGRDSPEFNEIQKPIRERLWRKASPKEGGAGFDGNAVLREINGETEGSLGRAFYREMFTPAELANMRRLSTTLTHLSGRGKGTGTVWIQLTQAGMLAGLGTSGLAGAGSLGAFLLGSGGMGWLMSNPKATTAFLRIANMGKNAPPKVAARALTMFLAQAATAGMFNTHDGIIEVSPDVAKTLTTQTGASDLGLAVGQ